MRYADILKCDCINGLGWGVSLYTQGCPHRCNQCFNPETWDFNGGQEFDEEVENKFLSLLDKPYINRASCLGGEPLIKQNREKLASLLFKIKMTHPEIKLWMWTGYTWEELMKELDQNDEQYSRDSAAQNLCTILFCLDVLVDGPFIQEKKDLTLKWRGSSNQRVIDVPKSFLGNEIVLYSD